LLKKKKIVNVYFSIDSFAFDRDIFGAEHCGSVILIIKIHEKTYFP